jgi:hypothetical protein
MKALVLFSTLTLASLSFAQAVQSQGEQRTDKVKKKKHGESTVSDVGGGVGTAASGAAKGAGSAAAGAGKGAADLATLHPIDAGAAVGTGAVKGGKDVGVGAVKGTGRVGKGIGHALRKIL